MWDMWSLTWCEVCQHEISFSCFLLLLGDCTKFALAHAIALEPHKFDCQYCA